MRWLGKLAEQENVKLYLVGGAIRDRLNKDNTLDIDLACEGSVKHLGKRLAKELDAKFIYYPSFQTGTIESLQGARIDLAATRKETYPRKGELPKVEHASIHEDIYRRDFTINAIAESLNPGEYGKILDPLNGISDIKKRLIRVLHDESFEDDPTRIFRAVRYSARLRFRIEPETFNLLKRSVPRLIKLSGERILYELKCIAREDSKVRVNTIKRLEALGALNFLGKPLRPLSPTELNRISSDDSCAFLCFLLSHFENASLSKLPLSKRCLNTIETISKIYILQTELKKPRKPSQITSVLKKYDERGLEIITVTSKFKVFQKIISYLENYSKIKIKTTGEDLKRLGIKPGPKYGEILDLILKARLDGLIEGKKEEIRYAKKFLEGC